MVKRFDRFIKSVAVPPYPKFCSSLNSVLSGKQELKGVDIGVEESPEWA
jgi:hypothetical protein